MMLPNHSIEVTTSYKCRAERTADILNLYTTELVTQIMMKTTMIISTILISLIIFQGTNSGFNILVEARHLADESSSEHPASSLLGTPNIGSSFGVMKTGFTENYTTKFRSPPPPPKSATPPHHAPTPPKHIPTITDLLDRSPPSTPYISSA
ncbi:hypothetical protein ACFX12_019445 [Malus domestica]